MKNFLSDLWHDLREKRLWPVAVLLLAALVAVPVVLSKPSETPAPAPAPTEARTAPEPRELKELASVKLAESAAGTGSSLDTFDPDNPFRPPRSVLRNGQQTASDSGPQSGGSAGGGGGPAPSGDNNLVVGGDLVGGGGGGDTGIDTGGGDTGGGDTPGDKTKTTQYAYVIDVTFEANGRTRKIKSMNRLDMLPSVESPLLLFLGVASDGGNAVFLVDSTLQAAGEGSCKPSDEECAFLHLGPGSEHAFTNLEGDSYTLRVDEIRRVKVGAKAGASKKDSKGGKPASAAVGRTAPARRFTLPLLADLVSVSSGSGADSNRDTDRR
jgi:hypothetical protein